MINFEINEWNSKNFKNAELDHFILISYYSKINSQYVLPKLPRYFNGTIFRFIIFFSSYYFLINFKQGTIISIKKINDISIIIEGWYFSIVAINFLMFCNSYCYILLNYRLTSVNGAQFSSIIFVSIMQACIRSCCI